MVRSSCFITLSEEWKNNRQINMKEVELGARDLQLVDHILQQLVFDRFPPRNLTPHDGFSSGLAWWMFPT